MKNTITKTVAGFAYAVAIAACFHSAPVLAAQLQSPQVPVQTQLLASDNYINGIDRNKSTNENENEITDSVKKKTGMHVLNGRTVYFNQFGNRATGQIETKDGVYYFDENGEKKTGFIETNGKTAWYDEKTGRKADQAQIVESEGKSYLLNENGEKASGWASFEGKEYYLDSDGSIIKGQTRDIDGFRYSFDANGVKEVSVTKGGYVYDAQGKGTEDLSGYDKIAKAALAQVGVNQDCTMLVTNSLKAVGIDFHGAPAAYLSLGPLTDNPVPGDIIVYQGHVAIYIGNGQAVHGGWNGYTTAVFSVNCSTPLIGYVHPVLP